MGQRIGEKELRFKGISYYQKKLNTSSLVINFANTDWDYSSIVVVSKNKISATEVNKQSLIEKQLEGKTELIIMPDGILGFLPFETLIMPDGRYLIEKYHINIHPVFNSIRVNSQA